jgi:hypothetical protein
MSRMVRKQVYLEARQDAALERAARSRGVSAAEIIRQALDSKLAALSAGRLTPDQTAWRDAVKLMRSLTSSTRTGRTWKREDAYEQRLARHGRNPR